MERDSQLDDAQAAAQVAARLGDGLDDRGAQFAAQLLELRLVHLAQVTRSGQVAQEGQAASPLVVRLTGTSPGLCVLCASTDQRPDSTTLSRPSPAPRTRRGSGRAP